MDTKVESLQWIDSETQELKANKITSHMKYCTRSFPSNVNSEHNGQRKKKLLNPRREQEAILEEKSQEVFGMVRVQ